MIQHAELLFYVFRDRLVASGNEGLGASIKEAVASSKVDLTLSEISGVFNKDIILDQTNNRAMLPLKDEEWLELIQVLEIEHSYSHSPREKSEGESASVESDDWQKVHT